MCRLTVLCTIILANVFNIHAQPYGKWHSFAAGTADYSVKDASLSLPELRGALQQYAYALEQEQARRKTRLEVQWQTGTFRRSGNTVRVNEWLLQLSDGYRIPGRHNNRFTAYAGYGIRLNPSLLKVAARQKDFYSWNTVNAVSVYQSYTYRLNRDRLSLDIYVPVAAVVSQPGEGDVFPVSLDGALYSSYSNPAIVSFNKYRSVSASLGYRRPLNGKWQLEGSLYYNYSDLRTIFPVCRETIGIKLGVLLYGGG